MLEHWPTCCSGIHSFGCPTVQKALIFRFPHDFENRIARHIPFLTMRRGSSGVSKMAVAQDSIWL